MPASTRCPDRILVTAVVFAMLSVIAVADDTPTTVAPQRPLWTKSRVTGFPDPPPPFHVRRIFDHLELPNPLSVTRLPGTADLLVTVHRGGYGGPGRLLRITGHGPDARVSEFLQIPDIIYGVAFHPDFARNGFMYVGCNGPSESLQKKATRVLRFHVSRMPPFECEAASQTLIIEWASDGHNGGDVAFGHDGMLYVSAGDGTSDSDARHAGQDLTTIPGSIIRIDVDHPSDDRPYSIPTDNPFLDVKDARPEIWACGLRNPWRISVDPQTGDLWAGNNGQDLWESVHVIRRGENYGWSINEGSHPFQPGRKQGPAPIVPPTIEHPHSEARSLTGGHVCYGSRHPSLHGHYLYGDYSTGMIWAARYEQGTVVSHFLVARTNLQIAGFGIDHDGELLVVDHGSGLYQLVPNEQTQSADFPRRLSETGIFTSVKHHQTDTGLIPYEVNSPLWSDGAFKERFIGLPGDSTIGFRTTGAWQFPEGTVLVKTFSLPLAGDNSDSVSLTRIETRLLTLLGGEWYGYSYAWNQDQTDAVLVEAAGRHVDFEVSETDNDTSERKQTWYFPSRSDCMVCHTRAADYVLGLSVLQTNRLVSVDGHPSSQLEDFHRRGLFHAAEGKAAAPPERDSENRPAFELPAPPEKLPRMADPYDTRLPAEDRVRSWLHANCAHCHVHAGGGNSRFAVSFQTPLDKTSLIGERPQHDAFGLPDAHLITPGDPSRSLLWHRVQHRGRGQMPPLGSSIADQQAVTLIADWIRSLQQNPVAAD